MRGTLYHVGETPMPLHPDHIGCVGFVTTYGVPVGTCFLVTFMEEMVIHGYVVTARHVLYNRGTKTKHPDIHVRFRELDGDRVQDLRAPTWIEHPIDDIDVAVAPISLTGEFLVGSLSMNLHAFDLTDIQAAPGGDVFYVGL